MTTPTEHEFYQDEGVQVTSARFITGGQTIAMSGVTAVTTLKHAMSRGEMMALGVGIICLIAAKDFIPAILIAVPCLAYAYWAYKNPVYALHLTSSSGKQRVLATRQRDRIFGIAKAVNEAIIHRA